MLARLPLAIAIAIVVTFGLFWSMQALISVGGELKEGSSGGAIEFVRLKRDNTPQEKKREPPKRAKPKQQPPPPEMNMAKNMNPSDAAGDIAPMINAAAELGKASELSSGGGDRDLVPLVRVEPDYPPKAKQRGIGGWVEFEFTIGPAGTVEDLKILRSSPRGVFDRAVLRAVRRWRYNPQMVDGKPVARPGIQVRLRFDP
jgi:protein TonB